jgi:uncharacterized protein YcbK (DUF882 family)
MKLRRPVLTTVSIALGVLFASSAQADVQHTVARGHTLRAIANRYHVSVKAILEANHLRNPKQLKVGDVLTIPTGSTPAPAGKAASAKAAPRAAAPTPAAASRNPRSYASRSKTPGTAHLVRLATKEELTLHITDRRRHLVAAAPKQIEHLMRSPNGGAAHAIDPRLVTLLGLVSDHFGGRKIEVVSGFRPYTPTQYTKDSNHNHGRAVDFRVVGVPNEVTRDFCRTLHNVGCGYYPNSVFVHMDVRAASAYWIDYSKPGEPPRYHAPNVDADEGTSDVHAEGGKNEPAPAAPEPEAPAAHDTAAPPAKEEKTE